MLARVNEKNSFGTMMVNEMDQKLKTKWIKALRSGKFKQGKFYFEKDNHFCCLGVLCYTQEKTIMLNEITSNWSAVDMISDKDQSILTIMNDGFQGDVKTFPEIADWIESNL